LSSSGLRTMNGPGSTEQQLLREQRAFTGRAQDGRSAARLVSASAVRSIGTPAGSPNAIRLNTIIETSIPHASARTQMRAGPIADQVVKLPPRTLSAGEQQISGKLAMAVRMVDRTARLTMDAVLLLVFSPVIAIWWLLERRNRKA
jgi:hypothetical protein